MEMDNTTLATELLHEVKMAGRRWFIAFIVVLVLWFATIGVFIWYITLPVEEEITYTQETDGDANTQQIIGGDYNGKEEFEHTESDEIP